MNDDGGLFLLIAMALFLAIAGILMWWHHRACTALHAECYQECGTKQWTTDACGNRVRTEACQRYSESCIVYG